MLAPAREDAHAWVMICMAARPRQVCHQRAFVPPAHVRAPLDRVAAGEHITITVDGRPVATLVPPEPRHRWMLREAFAARILGQQADPGLTADLGELAPDTTDDLPL